MRYSAILLAAALACGILPRSSFAQGLSAPPPVAAVADFSKDPTADALWFHIQDLKKGPKTRPSSPQEYRFVIANMVSQINAGTAEFLKRYPDDPRKWDARLLQIETGNSMSTMSGRPNTAANTQDLQQLAAESDASVSVRGQARHDLLGLAVRSYTERDKSVTADSLVQQLKQFVADFPTYPSLDNVKYQVAQVLNQSDPGVAAPLLNDLASGTGPIADQARKELATAEKLKSPLDLHFTAVDGTDVDLSKLRGKVVLVDFWATWCGPCRAGLPDVRTAYNKLHDKGFEIVGISLDQDKETLLKYTAGNSMPWPQYFDGKGWQNEISSSFGIRSIPTMWLVNKKGYVVSTNGRDNLEGQVEKLLAE